MSTTISAIRRGFHDPHDGEGPPSGSSTGAGKGMARVTRRFAARQAAEDVTARIGNTTDRVVIAAIVAGATRARPEA